jgi:hypothetical protein
MLQMYQAKKGVSLGLFFSGACSFLSLGFSYSCVNYTTRQPGEVPKEATTKHNRQPVLQLVSQGTRPYE